MKSRSCKVRTKPDQGRKTQIHPNHEMSLGESRVRMQFNPSTNPTVDEIKQKTAELIDLCESMKERPPSAGAPDDREFLRLLALAQTHYEDAAMWAVKAATI
jgi:hypothetical protein